SLKWPLLIADLDEEPRLLTHLQRLALHQSVSASSPNEPSAANEQSRTPIDEVARELEQTLGMQRWARRPDLMRFLRVGCVANNDAAVVMVAKEDVWSLADLDLTKLLNTAPRVHQISLWQRRQGPGVQMSSPQSVAGGESSFDPFRSAGDTDQKSEPQRGGTGNLPEDQAEEVFRRDV